MDRTGLENKYVRHSEKFLSMISKKMNSVIDDTKQEAIGVVQKLRGQNEVGKWSKNAPFVHVQGKKYQRYGTWSKNQAKYPRCY